MSVSNMATFLIIKLLNLFEYLVRFQLREAVFLPVFNNFLDSRDIPKEGAKTFYFPLSLLGSTDRDSGELTGENSYP